MNSTAPQQRRSKLHLAGNLVAAVFVCFVVLVGVTMLFGDNLRALFGMSADGLAGYDLDSEAVARPPPTRKTMKSFGVSGGYGEAPAPAAPAAPAPSRAVPAPSRAQGNVVAVDPSAFAGRLTAGAFDDNANFDEFVSFTHRAPFGAPLVPRYDRLAVHVVGRDSSPTFGAPVELLDDDGKVLQRVRTGADGVAWLYPSWGIAAASAATVRSGQSTTRVPSTATGWAHVTLQSDTQAVAPRALDVAVVLDTTSSMADELSWLQREVEHLSRTLAETHPQVSQRWSLITYRDEGDEYVVRARPLQPLASFNQELLAESAGGGGDVPEALDEALGAAAQLAWRPASARVVLHFADASHHPGKERAVLDALAQLRAAGARVYPVASSGTYGLAEHTLRAEAQLTGGQYLFLTDDSGVGGAHATPEVSCFQVTLLEVALRAAVERELTSTRLETPSLAVLRTGSQSQRCALEGGRAITQR